MELSCPHFSVRTRVHVRARWTRVCMAFTRDAHQTSTHAQTHGQGYMHACEFGNRCGRPTAQVKEKLELSSRCWNSHTFPNPFRTRDPAQSAHIVSSTDVHSRSALRVLWCSVLGRRSENVWLRANERALLDTIAEKIEGYNLGSELSGFADVFCPLLQRGFVAEQKIDALVHGPAEATSLRLDRFFHRRARMFEVAGDRHDQTP